MINYSNALQKTRENLDRIREELATSTNMFDTEFEAIDMLLLKVICQYKEMNNEKNDDLLKLIDKVLPSLLEKL